MRSTTLTALVLASFALTACGDDTTAARIDVVVSAGNPPPGLDLESIAIIVTRVSGSTDEAYLDDRGAAIYQSGRLAPRVLRVSPRSDADVGSRLYRFRAVGLVAGVERVAAQSRLVFVPGAVVTLPLRLTEPCVDVSCGSDQTCAAGVCTDDFVPSCELIDLDERPAFCDRSMDAGFEAGDGALEDLGDGALADGGDGAPADLGPMPDVRDTSVPDADVGTSSCATALDCDDGIDCTRDECRAPTCLNEPDDSLCIAGFRCDPVRGGCARDGCATATDCDDGDPCTEDRCDASRCSSRRITCDDGDPCTSDACDAITGMCTAPTSPDGAACGGAGLTCCAGRCLDVGSDPTSCGSCGRLCGINASCAGGSCACAMGFQDCDAAPGCESSAATDAANCGRCGRRCAAPTPACIGGACGSCATAADCPDDGLSCTGPATCTAGACVHPQLPNTCFIAGVCYAQNAPNPANGCQQCTPTTSATAWSNRTGTCDDGLYCTINDVCSAGVCSGSPRNCDDMLTCTTDACNEAMNLCTHTLSAGSCLIGGNCYAMSVQNPTNGCQHCDPATSPSAWSNRTGSCADGLYCTSPDVCTAGVCSGPIRSCADGFACTDNTCNETTNACENPVSAGRCLIASTCYMAGDRNPTNDCQECIPATSQTAWSNRTGTCNDGLYCTVSDACSAGTCTGSPRNCSDTFACTTESCNEAMDRCTYTVNAGSCLIDNACWTNGQVNPANTCQYCNSVAGSRQMWSNATGSCDDGLFCTVNDTCSAGSCSGTPHPCDDVLACTADTCNETTNVCVNTLLPGACLIAGVCYPAGAVNPANECQECRPGTSTTTWSQRPSGSTACGTGNGFCCGGACVGCTNLACSSCGSPCGFPSVCDPDVCMCTIAAGG